MFAIHPELVKDVNYNNHPNNNKNFNKAALNHFGIGRVSFDGY